MPLRCKLCCLSYILRLAAILDNLVQYFCEVSVDDGSCHMKATKIGAQRHRKVGTLSRYARLMFFWEKVPSHRGGSSIGVWGGPLMEGDLGVWERSPQENFSKLRPSNSLRLWVTPLLVYLLNLKLHHLADHLHVFSTQNLKMKLISLSEH